MFSVAEQSKDQGRWNQLGVKQLEAIRREPNQHILGKSPLHWLAAANELMSLLVPLEGKRILELGCGWGQSSILLAQQGAKVTGVDIGPDLIAAAKALAAVNEVTCEFQTANILSLPFESEAFDFVFGIAVLHHLSKSDVSKALAETDRVLTQTGLAVFIEPIENSKVFNFIQNLMPAGQKGSDWYRPSILQRRAWKEYLTSCDNRVLTTAELVSEGQKRFQSVRISPYGFLVRLARLIGERYRQILQRFDEFIFRTFPAVGWLSQTVLVEYRKVGTSTNSDPSPPRVSVKTRA